jgi:F0F1-type ATP synthase assembly protein I
VTDDGTGRRDGPTGGKPNWGLAFDLGLRLGISILIGLGGGLVVDGWLHTSPLFTLIGMVFGIGAAMVTIWNVARAAMRK